MQSEPPIPVYEKEPHPFARAQDGNEDRSRITALSARGAEHRADSLKSGSTFPTPIATATALAGRDERAELLFRKIVCSRNAELAEEGEEGGSLLAQVLGESPVGLVLLAHF